MSFNLGQGIAQIIADIPSTRTPATGGAFSADFMRQNGYKMMAEQLELYSTFNVKIASATQTDTTINFTYADDHFYKMLKNFQWKLNSNDIVKDLNDLSYFRILYHINNIGFRPFTNAPKSVVIPAGETETQVKVVFNIPMPLISEQNINFLSTFICTWIWQNITLTGNSSNIANIISCDNNATIEPIDFYFETKGEFWIVDSDYLNASTEQGVMEKMGFIPKATTKTAPFTSQGANQVVELNPTDIDDLNRVILIAREANTGKRVDINKLIKNIRFADGDRPLVNCSPINLMQFTANRYNLNIETSWGATNSDELDGIGALYGVTIIDTSFFGDLINGVLATGAWTRPKLYLDIADVSGLSGGMELTIITEAINRPQSLQNRVNDFVVKARSV